MQEVSDRDYGRLEGKVDSLADWRIEHMAEHAKFSVEFSDYIKKQSRFQGGLVLIQVILGLTVPTLIGYLLTH